MWSKHSGMIQAQRDTAHLEHIWHFACVVGPENKHSVRRKKYLQWHSSFMCWWWNFFYRLFFRIMASHFIWSFFWQALWNIHVILPAQKICCQFLWVWGIISEYVSLHFPAFAQNVLNEAYRERILAFVLTTLNGFWLAEIIGICVLRGVSPKTDKLF